jgi:hypothetical protein
MSFYLLLGPAKSGEEINMSRLHCQMVLTSKDEASKTSAKNEAWLSKSFQMFQDLSKIFSHQS